MCPTARLCSELHLWNCFVSYTVFSYCIRTSLKVDDFRWIVITDQLTTRRSQSFLFKFFCHILQVGALTVMAVGIWTILDKSYLENLMRNTLYMSAAYTLIAVGAITIIISFLGCMGSFAVSLIYYSINICKAVTVYYKGPDRLWV